MCNRVTWISDEKVTELFEELADLRGRVNTEYQRGREDAAWDVTKVSCLRDTDLCDITEAIAAARGGGEPSGT